MINFLHVDHICIEYRTTFPTVRISLGNKYYSASTWFFLSVSKHVTEVFSKVHVTIAHLNYSRGKSCFEKPCCCDFGVSL